MENLDAALLRALQADGRATFSDLAKTHGASRSAVAARVNHLLGSGEISVLAAVHPRVLGLEAQAHLSIRVSGDTSPAARCLDAIEATVYISETTGSHQLVAEIRTTGIPSLYSIISAVRAAEGVLDVEVLIYERIIRSFFLGEEPQLSGLSLDDADIIIMDILQRDGRAGFAELAAAAGLSVSACRTRVLRLFEANVMRVGAVRRRDGASGDVLFGIGLAVKGDPTSVVDVLTQLEGAEFVVRTVGRFSVVATLCAPSMAEYSRIASELRSLPGVVLAETWVHTRILLEQYERSLEPLVAGIGS